MDQSLLDYSLRQDKSLVRQNQTSSGLPPGVNPRQTVPNVPDVNTSGRIRTNLDDLQVVGGPPSEVNLTDDNFKRNLLRRDNDNVPPPKPFDYSAEDIREADLIENTEGPQLPFTSKLPGMKYLGPYLYKLTAGMAPFPVYLGGGKTTSVKDLTQAAVDAHKYYHDLPESAITEFAEATAEIVGEALSWSKLVKFTKGGLMQLSRLPKMSARMSKAIPKFLGSRVGETVLESGTAVGMLGPVAVLTPNQLPLKLTGHEQRPGVSKGDAYFNLAITVVGLAAFGSILGAIRGWRNRATKLNVSKFPKGLSEKARSKSKTALLDIAATVERATPGWDKMVAKMTAEEKQILHKQIVYGLADSKKDGVAVLTAAKLDPDIPTSIYLELKTIWSQGFTTYAEKLVVSSSLLKKYGYVLENVVKKRKIAQEHLVQIGNDILNDAIEKSTAVKEVLQRGKKEGIAMAEKITGKIIRATKKSAPDLSSIDVLTEPIVRKAALDVALTKKAGAKYLKENFGIAEQPARVILNSMKRYKQSDELKNVYYLAEDLAAVGKQVKFTVTEVTKEGGEKVTQKIVNKELPKDFVKVNTIKKGTVIPGLGKVTTIGESKGVLTAYIRDANGKLIPKKVSDLLSSSAVKPKGGIKSSKKPPIIEKKKTSDVLPGNKKTISYEKGQLNALLKSGDIKKYSLDIFNVGQFTKKRIEGMTPEQIKTAITEFTNAETRMLTHIESEGIKHVNKLPNGEGLTHGDKLELIRDARRYLVGFQEKHGLVVKGTKGKKTDPLQSQADDVMKKKRAAEAYEKASGKKSAKSSSSKAPGAKKAASIEEALRVVKKAFRDDDKGRTRLFNKLRVKINKDLLIESDSQALTALKKAKKWLDSK